MGKPDDRRDYFTVLIAVIGVLVTVVGWFISQAVDQVKTKNLQIDRHLEHSDAENVTQNDRLLSLEFKTSKIR